MRKNSVRRLAMAAMMGAVAFVLMYFSFSIPVLSPFAELDLAALPELIGGFILGPLGAIEIISLKLLLKIVFKGSVSMMTGEIQNLILSISFVLPAVIYYRRHRTKKAAIIGLVIGAVLSIVLAVITNLYMILPFYIRLYGMDWDAIVAMCSAANPWVKDIPTMVAFSIIPFNVVSRTLQSLLTILLYKKISVPLKKLIQ
ncbi:MAG: ECF transporter S component [Oscillospiraceae bacterium]|nr:ECF transporter S component [Oscillospiraceae bacterium]